MLRAAECTWTVRDESSNDEAPPGRSGHTLTVVGRAAYMFGGVSQPVTKQGKLMTKLDALRQVRGGFPARFPPSLSALLPHPTHTLRSTLAP